MDSKITVKLRGANRIDNSKDGNPRFDVLTSEGIFRTEPDAAVNYELPNYVGLADQVTDSWLGREVELTVRGPYQQVIGIGLLP